MRSMNKIILRTDFHSFGLILPMKTGIIWEHQCDGVACNQLQVEGIFIPLNEKYFRFEFDELGDKHYYYAEKDLPFYFEYALDEVKLKLCDEANDWIIFKGWKDKEDYQAKEWDKLIGKKMVLIYTNSD